ncbi:MAG: hypothetical protein WCA46_13885 [Actinocatenispora sp.]
MPLRNSGLTRRIGAPVLAVLAAAAVVGTAAPVQAHTAPSRTTTAQSVEGPQRSGSGTVNDPWVPMREAHTTCQSATLFGNYSGSAGHSNPIASLPAGTWIGVRYVTSNNYSADVLWHNHGQWGFMLRSCFAFD